MIRNYATFNIDFGVRKLGVMSPWFTLILIELFGSVFWEDSRLMGP